MVADIEELEETDASELHVRRLNAKEVLTPQRSGNFIFPVEDGTVDLRRIHLSSSRCTLSQTVRAERRIISYSVKIHRRYQNNTYNT